MALPEAMRVVLKVLDAAYHDADVRLELKVEHYVSESLGFMENYVLPTTSFVRTYEQVMQFQQLLQCEHKELLLPVHLASFDTTDPRWGSNAALGSIKWHVERYFQWILSKKEVLASELLKDFSTGLYRKRFRHFFDNLKSSIRNLTQTFNYVDSSRIREGDEWRPILRSIEDRSDSLAELQEALRYQQAWSRNMGGAREEVARCLVEVAEGHDGTELPEAQSHLDLIGKIRDIQDHHDFTAYDQLELTLSMLIKESKAVKLFITSNYSERNQDNPDDDRLDHVRREVNWLCEESDRDLVQALGEFRDRQLEKNIQVEAIL